MINSTVSYKTYAISCNNVTVWIKLVNTRVMIVEDEGLIATDIAGELSTRGYEITAICASGEEALANLPQMPPDLVLMDIRLSGKLDGIDTAVRIRSEYNLPVVFLTSNADRDTLARAKQANPFGFLRKPFRQINLHSAIEAALVKFRQEALLPDPGNATQSS